MGANRKGNRSAKRTQAVTLATAFPDRMRAAMEPLFDKYLVEFEYDLTHRTLDASECPTCHRTSDEDPQPNPAHRTAMDMYPRIMRVVGASDDLIEALLKRLNMPSEAEMLAAADLYRAVQGRDVVEIYRECKRLVDWCEGDSGPPEVARLLDAEKHTNGSKP